MNSIVLFKRIAVLTALLASTIGAFAQQFEAAQIDTVPFDKIKPYIGGDFALQFQNLKNEADEIKLVPLGTGFNLPTANMRLGAPLAQGMKVELEIYLSARHHNETWVKGGYLLVDKMPFIKSELIDKAMNNLTFKAGIMDLNYGDAHFRRSDNGSVLNNPFVGNYIMNAFTTAPAFEAYYRNDMGIIAEAGISQTIVNQVLVSYDKNERDFVTYDTKDELSEYFKLGYDKKFAEDLRLRATGSFFTGKNHSLSLYNGDRAGSRYYLVMNQQKDSLTTATDIKSNHLGGDYSPSSTGTVVKDQSIMLNVFATVKWFEICGFYESANGQTAAWDKKKKEYVETDFKFSQIAAELLVRFGGKKQFYAGGRYNIVQDGNDQKVTRIQGIGGWYLTKNVVTKVEYVNQTYDNFAVYKKGNAGFNGMMVEAAISF